jgi:hypothetical protein
MKIYHSHHINRNNFITHLHKLIATQLAVERSTRISAADSSISGISVNADHTLVDIAEELFTLRVGHDGHVGEKVHDVGLAAAVARDSPAAQSHEVILKLVVEVAGARQVGQSDEICMVRLDITNQ